MKKNILIFIAGFIIGSTCLSIYHRQKMKSWSGAYIDMSTRQNLMMLEMIREDRIDDVIELKEQLILFSLHEEKSPFNQWSSNEWKRQFKEQVEEYKTKFPESSLDQYMKRTKKEKLSSK